MNDLMLFHCPPACSRVTMVALEETGLAYTDTLIDLMGGQQKKPEYLAVNPKGKVPALRVDGTVLTENPVILDFLDRLAPEAELLPRGHAPAARATYLADLVWASSGLHTAILRQVVAPFRLTEGDPAGVKAKGLSLLADQAEAVSARIAAGIWWYGSNWSIMDVYLSWIFTTAKVGGFDLGRFPVLIEHDQRVRARPAFQRALVREKEVLDRAGITLPSAPPPPAPAQRAVVG